MVMGLDDRAPRPSELAAMTALLEEGLNAGALGLSLLFVLIALAFVTQPEQTIGRASRWSNDMSAAFLSLSSSGSVGGEQQAKQQPGESEGTQRRLHLLNSLWLEPQTAAMPHDAHPPDRFAMRSRPAHLLAVYRQTQQPLARCPNNAAAVWVLGRYCRL